MKRILPLLMILAVLAGCSKDRYEPPPVPPDPTPTPTPPDPGPGPGPGPTPVVQPVSVETWKRVNLGMTLDEVKAILVESAYKISDLGLADGQDPTSKKTGYAWIATLEGGDQGYFEVHFVKGKSIAAFPFQ